MAERKDPQNAERLSRRDFIQAVAAGGAGLLLSQTAFGQAGSDDAKASPRPAPAILTSPGAIVNLGLIGAGAQGRVLLDAILRPGPGQNNHQIKIKAVCDIWEYYRKYVQRYLKAYKHGDVAAYEDYREMLADARKLGLDGVIVATPDWMHAEQTIAVLEAGLHCYCESEMATTLEDARRMVLAARRTGMLLQIGQERRSSPRYLFAYEELIRKRKIFGRLAQARAQWNRFPSGNQDRGWPRGKEIAPEVLARYGYESMHHLCNWQWYRKYGNGLAVRLGGHQIDVMNWFLGAHPRSVIANGTHEDGLKHDWCENVMCILDYATPEGPALANFQTGPATRCEGINETFQGSDGQLVISEYGRSTRVTSNDSGRWDCWVKEKVLLKKSAGFERYPADRRDLAEVHDSVDPEDYLLPIVIDAPYQQPHLQNFVDAIRKGTPLNCPAEVGYATAVVTLAINRAIETGEKVTFKPEDFVV